MKTENKYTGLIRMRRKSFLSILLVCLLLGASVPARAEDAPEEADQAAAAERGRQALLDTGHAGYLHFPEEEDYLTEWKTLYARKAFRAPSLEVKSVPDQLDSDFPNMAYLFEGTKVTVVAEQGEMSCFIYHGSNNKQYCGWIRSIRLLEEFPGPTLISGKERTDVRRIEKDPEITWGEPGYQKFWHRFSSLSEPVVGCVGFTLEYQIIKRNTRELDIYCPRDIWVNTGEKWVQAGSFDYPEGGAVKVQVWLDEPTDIAAIGTVARCHDPDLFLTRQTAYDFCVAGS